MADNQILRPPRRNETLIMDIDDQEPPVRDTLAQMSHELRTPLTSIIGFTELMLEDDTIRGESREYLNILAEETDRLRKSLQHYLSVLKLENEAKKDQ